MKTKDFVRMPIGIFNATDGIYNYTIEKSITKTDYKFMYTIKDTLSLERVSLFEEEEDYFEENEKFKYKSLSAISGAGGISVHGRVHYYDIDKLQLLPRGSYKNLPK